MIGLSSKDSKAKVFYLVSRNLMSRTVNLQAFHIRCGFNIDNIFIILPKILLLPSKCYYELIVIIFLVPKDSELPHPLTPSLLEPRVNYLKMLVVKDKRTTLHIFKVVNNLTLSILAQKLPFVVPHCVGNLFPYLPNGKELS